MNENIHEKKKIDTKKRRREWGAVFVSVFLLFILTHYEARVFEIAAELPINNSIFALGLININILLIIFLLFLLFRNIFKLLLERRRGMPGSKVRTKLVAAFVALSLIPTMLLFFVSAGFITNSIENWFNKQIESSLEESLNVAQVYYKTSAENAIYYSTQIASSIKNNKLLNENNLPQLSELIAQKQVEYNLGVVEVFSSTLEELVRVANPNIPINDFTDPSSDSIVEALTGSSFTQVSPIGRADLIRGIVPIYSNWNDADIVGVVVANYYVPHSLVSKVREISSSFDQYKSAKRLKDKIKMGYVVVLLLIALLIIFMATWFGFHLARGITEPIQELVAATEDIASGNLDVVIERRSDDELGSLVKAFNRMTADLRRSRSDLQDANIELTSSNAELDQRRSYMEVVLRNIAAGVVSVDNNGVLTTINTSAENLLRLRGRSVLGKSYLSLLSDQQKQVVSGIFQELFASEHDSLRQQVSLSVGGRKLNLLVNVTRMRDESGAFIGAVVVFDDLTNLIKAQRMAAWREVARRIAHEIKNPLTPIKLSAQRLRRKYLDQFEDEDGVFDECTAMIVRQVDELKDMVNEFSNFARLPASNPEPDNLNEIVQEVLVIYQQGHQHINFQLFVDEHLPMIDIDRQQMKRVLINLIENAIAALGDQGSIEISVDYERELNLVTISIADNGPGIPDKDKPRLFEPYFSTKTSGTGLGLTIVSTIISDHNGYIRVRDNEPKGTKFVIELPVGEIANNGKAEAKYSTVMNDDAMDEDGEDAIV